MFPYLKLADEKAFLRLDATVQPSKGAYSLLNLYESLMLKHLGIVFFHPFDACLSEVIENPKRRSSCFSRDPNSVPAVAPTLNHVKKRDCPMLTSCPFSQVSHFNLFETTPCRNEACALRSTQPRKLFAAACPGQSAEGPGISIRWCTRKSWWTRRSACA